MFTALLIYSITYSPQNYLFTAYHTPATAPLPPSFLPLKPYPNPSFPNKADDKIIQQWALASTQATISREMSMAALSSSHTGISEQVAAKSQGLWGHKTTARRFVARILKLDGELICVQDGDGIIWLAMLGRGQPGLMKMGRQK